MRIYLINLPSTLNDTKAMIETDEQDLFIENIEFPEKVDEGISIDTGFHKDQYGFPLSGSETLNFMAHRKVWKQFLNTHESWCLVLEDNVNIHIMLQEINAVVRELPDNWELFFPYDPRDRMKVNYKENVAKQLVNPNSREIGDWEPYAAGFRWGNSIYFVSRNGAEKLLAINTIRQRLDDEILTMIDEKKVKAFVGEVEWFDYTQVKPVLFEDRNQLIWNAICENSTWTSLRKESVRHLLKVMNNTANKLNIDLVLQGGTHLGYVRHGGIMPWDDDVDIGIEENKLPLFLNHLSSIEGICYGEVIEPHTRVPFYKVWHKDGEVIENHPYTFPFVDLWLFNRKGTDIIFKNGIICPGSAAHDFVEVIFEGSPFKITYNSIEILDTRYKDWKKKIRVYTWSHCFEKDRFIPLSLDIEVNAEGRMIK